MKVLNRKKKKSSNANRDECWKWRGNIKGEGGELIYNLAGEVA